MRQRTRKLFGVIFILLFLVAYALVMMAIGAMLAGRAPGFWQRLAYHAVAGLAWLPVVMLIIKWMARPDADDGRR